MDEETDRWMDAGYYPMYVTGIWSRAVRHLRTNIYIYISD